jgi:hypothetical protein
MLLPALLALSLRRRQTERLAAPDARARSLFGAAFAEGLLWSAAFWIKPFVAVPALLCWLLSACLTWREPGAQRRRLLLDGAGLFAGGLTAGGVGCAWLVGSGAWPSFVEIVFVWNRQYVGYRFTGEIDSISRTNVLMRLYPWMLLHVLAVPIALGWVWAAVAGPPNQRTEDRGQRTENKPRRSAFLSSVLCPLSSGSAAQALHGGLYLGWLLQACCLQQQFDYVLAPTVPLALAVLLSRCVSANERVMRGAAAALVGLGVLWSFPVICLHRLDFWARCVREGGTADLHDRLTLGGQTSWTDLERVRDFLREQGVADGELAGSDMGPLPLYVGLGVRPATRFTCLRKTVLVFKQQRPAIYAELAASRQRFMVCDADGEGLGRSPLRAVLRAAEAPEGANSSPPAAAYPWAERIVFRAGRYVVFRLSGPETPRWLEETFDL